MRTMYEEFALRNRYKNPDKDVLIGIEVEVEGYAEPNEDGNYDEPDDLSTNWRIVRDGSLRNGGAEFILAEPRAGEQLGLDVENLFCYLNGYGCSISHRCSVHFHLNFCENTLEDVRKFFILYSLFEPSIYSIGRKDRYENIYCPGLTHATEQLKQAAVLLYQDSARYLAEHWCKYTGINFKPLSHLGTVEIRVHSGTLEGNSVLNFVRILKELYLAACSLSEEQVQEITRMDVRSATSAVFTTAFNDVLTENLLKYYNNSKLNVQYMAAIRDVVKHAMPKTGGLSGIVAHVQATAIGEF